MKRLLIGMIVLVFSFGFAGCNDNEMEEKMNVAYTISFQDLENNFFGENCFKTFIHSFEEWSEVNNKPTSLMNKYSKEYFENNSLIIYTFSKGTQGNEMNVTKISKTKNELIIEIDVRLGYLDAISSGIIIIEISKSDSKNINSIKILENFIE